MMFNLTLMEDFEGRRYMRVSDAADIMRHIARNLESAGTVDGRVVGDQIREDAKNLEQKVASYKKERP